MIWLGDLFPYKKSKFLQFYITSPLRKLFRKGDMISDSFQVNLEADMPGVKL